jgi:hypothetical protein
MRYEDAARQTLKIMLAKHDFDPKSRDCLPCKRSLREIPDSYALSRE